MFSRILQKVRGRNDDVVIGSSQRTDVEFIKQSGLFDADYYLTSNPDVAGSNFDPLLHYVLYGAAEGRNPNASFDAKAYLSENPEVSASGINPLRHFCEKNLRAGGAGSSIEGGLSLGAGYESEAASQDEKDDLYRILSQSWLFDREFYLREYPGVAAAGVDPVRHYIVHGAHECKNPHPLFDTNYYLERNKDVRDSGMNPLHHFCKYGWNELRDPSPKLDITWHWVMDRPKSVDDLCFFANSTATKIPRPHGKLTASEAAVFVSSFHGVLADNATELGVRQLNAIKSYAMEHDLWGVAEDAIRLLIGLEPNEMKYRVNLADAVEKQGRPWQVLDVLEAAICIAPSVPELQFRMGDASERMGNFSRAAQAFGTAVSLRPSDAIWHYRLGCCLLMSGQTEEAEIAYRKAVELGEKHAAGRYGIGVYHQLQGKWTEAADAYAKQLMTRPFDADLRFKHGFCLDRCYRWPDAEKAYRAALTLDFRPEYWHYRLGFVLERQGKYRQAGASYRTAAELAREAKPYWRYRAGYCLEKAGDYREACEQHLLSDIEEMSDKAAWSAVPHKQSFLYDASLLEGAVSRMLFDPDQLLLAARTKEWCGDICQAVEAYRLALARKSDHSPKWYYRLGSALCDLEEWEEACRAFRESRIFQRPLGVDSSLYQGETGVNVAMEYTEFVETLPLAERTVLYESYHGASVSCNPLAIFKYLLDSPEYVAWTHVWAVNDMACVPEEYRVRENVIWVRRGSSLYRRYLASASHLVNNNTFMPWFYRRDGQRYLMTWHGTPVKTLGKSIMGGFMEHKNASRNFLHSTHVLSPNRHTSEILANEYELRGVGRTSIAETGYPRIDAILCASAESKRSIVGKLGLDSSRPVVLYAPTWRGSLGKVNFDYEKTMACISSMVENGYQVIFRGHHIQESMMAGMDLKVAVVPQSIDTSEILPIVDILVTDYSSIMCDFLPLKRPIICYAYDLEEYAAERGLYFNLADLPVYVCETADALLDALKAASSGDLPTTQDVFEDVLRKFSLLEDGRATEKAVKFFFEDDSSCEVALANKSGNSILFYAGAFVPNGITTSIINLTSELVAAGNTVSVVVDPESVSRDPRRLEKFSELPMEVRKYARVGTMGATSEERWIIDSFNRGFAFLAPEMKRIYDKAFAREFRRMFGSAMFDNVVQFDGYSRFWASAFSAGKAGEMKSAIYLHNDMVGEMETRFPYLKGIFQLYEGYDRLVSVSSSANEANQQRLSRLCSIDASKFVYCDNILNSERIRSLAREPLPDWIDSWLGDSRLIGNLARLSPEKDHAKLICAFAEISKEHPDVKLVIGGDGPLRTELQELIQDESVEDKVLLAGQLMNPYPLLSRMELFVLSSKYEGQGIVLLEALVLGKAVISTDIPGPRSILCDGVGLLVKDSVEGLVDGIHKYLSAGLDMGKFGSEAYRSRAMSQFMRNVLH